MNHIGADVIDRIGFMQGRLSPLVDGKIQAFPWDHWQEELVIASKLGFKKMEWTLDQDQLYSNPLMTSTGQTEIKQLCDRTNVSIPSLTGDCFMQAPYWRVAGEERESRQRDFAAIVNACCAVGIKQIVVPLVDNGALTTQGEAKLLSEFLLSWEAKLKDSGTRIIFESDFSPKELAKFIGHFPEECFGINYDTGNSAALGFSVEKEFSSYGNRVTNVHIKDRVLGGTTVPLGEGNADFAAIFEQLRDFDYQGNIILQTARASDGNHSAALCDYRELTLGWMRTHES